MEEEKPKKDKLLPGSVILAALIIGLALFYRGGESGPEENQNEQGQASALEQKVLPAEGIILSARWGDLGAKMVSVGVIDKEKLEALYGGRGGFSPEERQILYGLDNANLVITSENAGFLLNLFWALGLANQNRILTDGPMNDSKYGGPGGFASTGGWTLSDGDSMEHYGRHRFFVLTEEQQTLVEEVSKNIYRPCCDNSTYFPDCNHGMAMLGILELMASQGASEEEMYRVALQVNSYWFPETYLTIAQYLAAKGVDWQEADPKEILGVNYSSGSGYRRILSEVTPIERKSGGSSCGA